MKRLSHNARVLVTDGGRATVFRNAGQPGCRDPEPGPARGRRGRGVPGRLCRLPRRSVVRSGAHLDAPVIPAAGLVAWQSKQSIFTAA